VKKQIFILGNFLSFIACFLLDGAVLLAPISCHILHPFDLLDGFLVDCWMHIFWWFSTIKTMACCSTGPTELWMNDYMLPMCLMKVACYLITHRSMSYIIYVPWGDYGVYSH
jgi:hypothetical protein